MRAIPIELSGKPKKHDKKESPMTNQKPNTDPGTPDEEKPVHDPSTIEVEHDPKDPNSPDFVPADDKS